jgi:F-type H+-transporting ATPase subunit b
MELVTPGIGLIFWTSVVFIVLIILLKKFAWKPILEAVEKRSNSIEEALNASEKAKEELTELNEEKDKLRKQALADRDALLKEAATTKAKIVADAKAQAKQETEKILTNAREVIRNEKMAAITELKNQVALLSLDIAEKIVKEQLSSSDKQKALVDNLVKEVNLN